MKDPINILIHGLDDNKQELELIQRKFEKENFTNFKLFNSVESFINEFTCNVAMAIVDFVLSSGMNGLDIFKRIDEINPGCYKIMLSGFASADDVITFNRKGVDDFVNKNNGDYLQELVEIVRTKADLAEHRTYFYNKYKTEQNGV